MEGAVKQDMAHRHHAHQSMAPNANNATTACACEQQLYDALSHYGGLVRQICRNILGSRSEDVEDCFQETFFAFWQIVSSAKLNPNVAIKNQRDYLCGIARNKARSRLRSIARHDHGSSLESLAMWGSDIAENTQGAEPTVEDEDIATLIDNERDAQLVEAAVLQLPDPARTIFVLRYWYCEPVKAIAQQLNLSAKSVENTLYRDKKQLRETLAAQGLEYKECRDE